MRLVELAHGESARRGEIVVVRLPLDPVHGHGDPREVVFYKRYLKGNGYLHVKDEALEDMAAAVWSWAEERLDEAARERRGCWRDGSPV